MSRYSNALLIVYTNLFESLYMLSLQELNWNLVKATRYINLVAKDFHKVVDNIPIILLQLLAIDRKPNMPTYV